MCCRYYIVFIVASIISGFFYLFFMPETKGLNLEELAAVFGDVVVSDGKRPRSPRLMRSMLGNRGLSASLPKSHDVINMSGGGCRSIAISLSNTPS
jgi:hypothetical protein